MFLADDTRLDTVHKKYLPRKGFFGTFFIIFPRFLWYLCGSMQTFAPEKSKF